ncbi:MAG: 3-deoxy-8-phosphooctulonate synthase [Pseudomonadota bacterium]
MKSFTPFQIAQVPVGGPIPFFILGPCALESETFAWEMARSLKEIADRTGIPFVFKASFDKANRSSINSFRGPGLEKGLQMLARIKQELQVPLLTDVHEPYQAEALAQVVDILQLPAFLSRQTDLVMAMAKSGAMINIKKAQFLAPKEMSHILRKFEEAGNRQLMLCERGSSFGYNNLVVDMLGFPIMKSFGYPVLFDVTHALQMPGGRSDSADGRRKDVLALARAGISQGIAGLFLEAHPDPDKALCDGPCALPLAVLEPFLQQLQALDTLVKSQAELVIR